MANKKNFVINKTGKKLVEIPDDILIPVAANANDAGRRTINPKASNSASNPGVANYAQSVNAVVQKSIAEGRIDVTPDLGDVVVTTTDTQSISGAKTFTSAITADSGITTGGDLSFTETVTSPATSASLAIKSKQLVHSVSGGATEVIPINIPSGAVLLGASILVSTVLAFTTGTEATPTWTNSTQQIGATTLAAKNSKVTALYDANANSAVTTTTETITLTPDAGTIDSGTVIVTAWYMELSGLTNVA